MLNPQDFFRFHYYLPLDGDSQLFQGTDWHGEVLTIKANGSHTHAIFRMESSGYYRDRMWENRLDIEKQTDRDALDRLKKQYEARQ